MPWRLRRIAYLVLFGALAMTLAAIVFVRHKSLDSELLGVLGLVTALSLILIALKWATEDGKDR